jgi:hypothetical protein
LDTVALTKKTGATANNTLYSPSTIGITPMSHAAGGSPAITNLRIQVDESTDGGSNWANKYNLDTSAKYTYTPTAQSTSQINMIRVTLSPAGATTPVLDQQLIPVVSDGVTAVLSNDAATLAANSSGTVSDYSTAVTTMYVYVGGVDDSANWAFTASPTNVSGALSATGNKNVYTVTNLTQDTGYVDITATKLGYASVTKRFTLSKSKAGNSSTAYWLVADTPAIKKSAGGSYTPASVNITAKTQTGTGNPTNYTCRLVISESSNNGNTWTDMAVATTQNADVSAFPYNYTPSAGITTLRIRLFPSGSVPSGTTNMMDEQTIPVVTDGTNGTSMTVAYVWAPNGNVCRNGQGNVLCECDVYNGASQVVSGITYQWYFADPSVLSDQGGGIGWGKIQASNTYGGCLNYTTYQLTVPAAAIQSVATVKCIATYSGTPYTDMITVVDQSDPIQLVLISDTGTIFKNGQGTKNVTCKVYQSGNEIDASGTTYQYHWNLYKQDGSLDTSFVDSSLTYKTGKTVTVNNTDVTNIGNLICSIYQ